jgi:hypothetical protein
MNVLQIKKLINEEWCVTVCKLANEVGIELGSHNQQQPGQHSWYRDKAVSWKIQSLKNGTGKCDEVKNVGNVPPLLLYAFMALTGKAITI